MTKPSQDPDSPVTATERLFCRKLLECGDTAKQRARAYAEIYEKEHVPYEHQLRAVNQILNRPRVIKYMERIQNMADEALVKHMIASQEDRRLFWTAFMLGKEYDPETEQFVERTDGQVTEDKDRLKASELLGKSYGDFIEKRQVEGNLTLRGLLEEINGAETGIGSGETQEDSEQPE